MYQEYMKILGQMAFVLLGVSAPEVIIAACGHWSKQANWVLKIFWVLRVTVLCTGLLSAYMLFATRTN